MLEKESQWPRPCLGLATVRTKRLSHVQRYNDNRVMSPFYTTKSLEEGFSIAYKGTVFSDPTTSARYSMVYGSCGLNIWCWDMVGKRRISPYPRYLPFALLRLLMRFCVL